MSDAKQRHGDRELQKYKELYDISKEVFDEEIRRAARVDEKAHRYLALLTVLLGIFSVFGKHLLKDVLPPQSRLDWLLIVLSAGCVALLAFAWVAIFNTVRIRNVMKIPIDLDFFHDNRLVNVYYGMARGIKTHLEFNRKQCDRKAQRLSSAFGLIRVIVALLVSLAVLFAADQWLTASTYSDEGGNQTMGDREERPSGNQGDSGDSPSEPDPDVAPPVFDMVTEGLSIGNESRSDSEADVGTESTESGSKD